MTARPDPFRTHVADQVLAALAEAGTPMSTPAIQYETNYGMRYGQLIYNVLTRLAKVGEVEKISAPGVKPVYWRRLTPQVSLPPMTVRSGRGRRRPS
jgi:hypothetical protein